MQLFSRRQQDRLACEANDVGRVQVETPEQRAVQPEVTSVPMDLYLLLYPNELEPEVVQTLEAAGVPGYTEFPKLIGRGREHRHFDNQIWPGSVGGVFTVINAEQAPTVVQPMQALNRHIEARTRGRHGVHMFKLPCQQIF
jgi:hypothetical protein